MHMQVLKGYEKAGGVEHTSTLRTVKTLGNIYSDQGKVQEAKAMYRRVLDVWDK